VAAASHFDRGIRFLVLDYEAMRGTDDGALRLARRQISARAPPFWSVRKVTMSFLARMFPARLGIIRTR